MRLKALQNKLADYSLLSGAFILMHQGAAGQVVYTDINPDTVFDAAEEGAYFDIDGNGVFDFAVLNSSFTFSTISYSDTILRKDILAGPLSPLNALAGINNHYSTSMGGFTRYFPYALDLNDLINEELNWQTAGLQIMAIKDYFESGYTGPCFNCFWYGFSIEKTTDHYLGFRFVDVSGEKHYGWMRCDVKDEGRTLIVKDYTYELQPEKPLLAGDTVSYVDVITLPPLQITKIYSFNNTIYVNIPNYQNTQITVYDITGNKIYNKILEGNSAVINMENFASGIYVVSVKQGENVVSKKVNVE